MEGFFVGVGVFVAVDVGVEVGVGVNVGVGLGVTVWVSVGATTVCVAKMLAAICVTVATFSLCDGPQADKMAQISDEAMNNSRLFFILGFPFPMVEDSIHHCQ
jgi:hypothetical protein